MFLVPNPDDLDGAEPSMPTAMRKYYAEGRPLFQSCPVARESARKARRRKRAIDVALAVAFLLALAAANYFNPCRLDGGRSCSEVSRP